MRDRHKRTVFGRIVGHVLASHVSAGSAGVAWDQSHRQHFSGPFLIVVGPARRVAELGLPLVNLFVDQRLQEFEVASVGQEVVWIRKIIEGFTSILAGQQKLPVNENKLNLAPSVRDLTRQTARPAHLRSEFHLSDGHQESFDAFWQYKCPTYKCPRWAGWFLRNGARAPFGASTRR